MSLVTAGVIMTEASTERVQSLFRPFLGYYELLDKKVPYHPIVGQDALVSGNLEAVFPSAKRGRSKFMKPEFADDLRTWLREPDHAVEQRTLLPLNPEQRRIATTRTQTGYRRVKGPAGCGKSLALAARAAHLASEGKEVLVVCFNITLLNYLRDLAVRYPHARGSVVQNITWLHFHEWCRRVCVEAGFEDKYKQLIGKSATKQMEGSQGLFEVQIPALVERALNEAGEAISRYDAILVDEGQDFNLTWWNLLRRVRREGGEMLLAADATQDLYRRFCYWTEESMRGAGFDGPWLQLEGSYRFPRKLIPHLRRFAEELLPGRDINLPTEVQEVLLDLPLSLRWIQVTKGDAVDVCVKAVIDMVGSSQAVTWSDITLLVPTHEIGLCCVERLEKGHNIRVSHVFAKDRHDQKPLKMGFWMGDARLKAST